MIRFNVLPPDSEQVELTSEFFSVSPSVAGLVVGSTLRANGVKAEEVGDFIRGVADRDITDVHGAKSIFMNAVTVVPSRGENNV